MLVKVHRFAGGLVLALAAAAAAAIAAPDAKDATAAGPAAPASAAAADPTAAPTPPAPAAATATPPAEAPRPAPQARPRLSAAITNQIAGALPAWKQPPPGAKPKAPPPPDTPDVVRMAPVIVDAYRIPNTAEKEWKTTRARDLALMERYLSPFDRGVLNRFTVPIIGLSNEARARMMYEEDKRLEDLKWINDQIDQLKTVDPKAAKDLEQVRNDTFTRTAQ